MTGKRFKKERGTFWDKDKRLNMDETVELLNELHEEIEYLKPLANENTQYIDDMEDDIITFKQKIKKLEKENKQLRTTLKELKEIGDYQADRIQELNDENEQLKSKLKDWHQRTFKAHEYFNLLEKVIDEVCNDDVSNQIWKEYEKREKLIE